MAKNAQILAFCALLCYPVPMITELAFNDINFRYAHESTINEADYFKHHHVQYEILYIVHGNGSFIIENDLYNFSEKTIIIVPPGKYHVMMIASPNLYERYVINFSPELFPKVLAEKRNYSICKIADSEMQQLFTKLHSYSERFSSEHFHSLLKSFLNEFLILFSVDTQHGALEKKDMPLLIKKAMEFINENINQPLNIETIASHLFVSRSYLNHLFKNFLNTGVMQYVRIKKMYEARKLLKSGVTAIQAASLLGYTNYSTFLRNYRAEFAENPINKTSNFAI